MLFKAKANSKNMENLAEEIRNSENLCKAWAFANTHKLMKRGWKKEDFLKYLSSILALTVVSTSIGLPAGAVPAEPEENSRFVRKGCHDFSETSWHILKQGPKFGTQKWDKPDFDLFFYVKTQRLSHFSRFIPFYRKETSKSKNRKTCCKNNKMYLSWTGDSHFVECHFWFLLNKFIPNDIRPADNSFVTPSHTCGEQFEHRSFFYFWLLCLRLRRVSFSSALSK